MKITLDPAPTDPTPPVPPEGSQPPAPVEAPVVKKEKKPLTDKQKENLKKGFAALQAKRKAKETEAEAPAPTPAPTPVPAPSLPPVAPSPAPAPAPKQKKPRTPQLTREEVMAMIASGVTAPPVGSQVPRAPPKVKERVVVQERLVSGNELLDRIFFGK